MEQTLQFLLPELGRRYRFIFIDNGTDYTLEHLSNEDVERHLTQLRHARRTTTFGEHPHYDTPLRDQEDADSIIHKWVVEDIPKLAKAIRAGRARLHKGVVFAHHVLRAQLRHRNDPLRQPEPHRCQPLVQYLNLNATLIHGYYLDRNQTRTLRSVNRTVWNKIQTIKDGEPDFITFKYLLRKEEFSDTFYDIMETVPYPAHDIFPIHDRRATWPAVLAFQWKHQKMTTGDYELTRPQEHVITIPYMHITLSDLELEKQYHTLRDILGLHVRHTPEITRTYQTGHLQCAMMANYVQAITYHKPWPQVDHALQVLGLVHRQKPARLATILGFFNVHDTIRAWYYAFIRGTVTFMTFPEVRNLLDTLHHNGIHRVPRSFIIDNGSYIQMDLDRLIGDMEAELTVTEGGPEFCATWVSMHTAEIVKYWYQQTRHNVYYRTIPIRQIRLCLTRSFKMFRYHKFMTIGVDKSSGESVALKLLYACLVIAY